MHIEQWKIQIEPKTKLNYNIHKQCLAYVYSQNLAKLGREGAPQNVETGGGGGGGREGISG